MVEPSSTGRLRRVEPGVGGIRRRRCGRGFRYLDAGQAVTDERTRARIKALVIPPAWQDVHTFRHGVLAGLSEIPRRPGRKQHPYRDLAGNPWMPPIPDPP